MSQLNYIILYIVFRVLKNYFFYFQKLYNLKTYYIRYVTPSKIIG